VVGVAGSIAAVESPRIIRELIRHGADVRVVMSPEAGRLVTPESLRFASGHPTITELTGDVEHVSLLGPGDARADLYLLAPATANTISKIAHGIDDTPVTSFASVALGGGVPMLVAPAMHAHMGRNPAVRENVERLRQWGVGFIEPRAEEGEEKVASPEDVAAAVLHRLAGGPWTGRSVVIIGGAARESIDEVRSVTNESSGLTAVALASQAFYRGANVELWLGATSVPVPSFLTARAWRSVGDLKGLIARQAETLARSSAVWVPAALSDYTLRAHPGKIDSRSTKELALTLTPAPRILPDLRRRTPRPAVLVGFKLESGLDADQLKVSAERLLHENHLDWVAANDQKSMGAEETELLLVRHDGRHHWIRGSKLDVAGELLDEVGRELPVAPPSHRITGGRSRRRRRSR
jgi:phosphopantothenoylcysteine decarboxylase / phosphopantothenate---cysteine ligase